PDVLDASGLPGRPHGSESRSVAAGREGSRVAVGQETRAFGDELDGARVEGSGARGCRIVAYLVERPPQIDGRRARRRQNLVRRVKVLAAPRRERETVGGGAPDRRGAADRERPDRVGAVLGRYAPQLELLVGQAPLVEEDDGITFEADDALRREVARGHRLSLRRGQRRTRDLAGSNVNHCLASASTLPSSCREVSALF